LQSINNPAWPIACEPINPKEFSINFELSNTVEVTEQFSERFGCDALVMPSGQAAIALAIKILGLGRGDAIHVPKWLAHCVWRAISGQTNASVSDHNCDAKLIVHHYGKINSISFADHYNIIEDSVDSLYSQGSEIFAANGRFNVVSLPKTLGTYSGGLIFFARPADYQKALEIIDTNIAHENINGAQRRFDRFCLSQRNVDPDVNEYRNFQTDTFLLRHITDALNTYNAKINIIRSRAAIIENITGLTSQSITKGRCGPCYLLPVQDSHIELTTNSLVQIRNIIIGHDFMEYQYERHYLLPLHFGISDSEFSRIIEFCKNAF
jgi:hypothetical protein